MPTLNRIELIGRLGADPKTRSTAKGSKVCTFSIAVDHHWKFGGESKKTTDWFNLEAWGKLGDICNKYLKKGRLVYVEGRVKTDKYESAGETRYFTKVIVANVQLLDKKIVDAEEEAMASEEAEE
jgi:single-strand DNA-binding protein